MNVTNSTIFFNFALADGAHAAIGGGIFNSGTVNVSNCTLSKNESIGPAAATTDGGGISNLGRANVKSTIIAKNEINPGGSAPDASGTFASQGFNLLGERDGSIGFTAITDQTGTIATPLDPKLHTNGLQNHGGPTETIALLIGSPALDKGTSRTLAGLTLINDQRGAGFARTFDDLAISNATGGDGTDMGAFEVQTAAPTPTPTPSTLANISTRLRVETGDNVLIGGFIITGTQPKKVIVRALGPSLPVAGKLANPTLELFGPSGLITANDNWMDAPNKQEIIASTVPPPNNLESAILMPLAPNAYTTIVRGVNNTTGVGLVEIYDLDSTADSTLANISTRGLVQTGDDVLIGGFIVLGTEPQRVIVRAIGPSLPVAGKLADPTLELHNPDGSILASNDNWRTTQESEIMETGLAPSDDLESAIVATLSPEAYTAIVRGKNSTTGVTLVEVYRLEN